MSVLCSGDMEQPLHETADFVAIDRLVREKYHLLAANASEDSV